ncbi:DUF6928 family protein [Streptomyces sp. NPDC056508]|uniref:DUF6928 family protein n=1 Tax=Streptomyces sp. NPDC056508 TaxID=3345845 RepID=UPI0036C4F65B
MGEQGGFYLRERTQSLAAPRTSGFFGTAGLSSVGASVRRMGAKTALLAYANGDVASALREAGEPTVEGTAALIAQVFPGWGMESAKGNVLGESTYPPERLTYAASFPGVDLVCDRRLMFDRPSELPAHLLETVASRRVILHAMHSVSDWLAFAVWEAGRLRRSLSLSPDGGIVENIGDPFPFEMPYWAGERPVEPDPEWDEEPYALPFHPLELGNDALRALFGFLLEGRPLPEDVDPDEVPLLGFELTDPDTSR